MYQPPDDEFPPRLSTRLRWAFPWLFSPVRMALLVVTLGAVTWAAQKGVDYLSTPPPVAGIRPESRLLRELGQLVDEARGMESLLVMIDGASERRDMETRMLRHHERVTRWLAGHRAGLVTASDATQVAELQAALDHWWSVQRQIVDAVPQGVPNREGVARSRQLLTGESAEAFSRVQKAVNSLVRRIDS